MSDLIVLKEIINILYDDPLAQTREYERGVLNGMILAMAVLEDDENPNYLRRKEVIEKDNVVILRVNT